MMKCINHKYKTGFSLIELVFFIIIIGVLAVGLMLPFSTLFSEAHHIDEQTRATQLAMGAMEFAIGEKRLKGFNALSTATVICGTTPCVVGNNTATVTVTSINSKFKKITAVVTGSGQATLTTVVSRY